jgi:hypothetical protein
MHFQQLNLNTGYEEMSGHQRALAIKEQGFFRRQFRGEGTKAQIKFDVIFGIVLPVACFFFDPGIFRSGFWGFGDSLFGIAKPFAYLISFTAIFGLIGFLLFGEKLRSLNTFFSGLFTVGAVFSLILAVVLLPFSIIGLILAFVGILGFVPFFTAFVFARNAVRAFKAAGLTIERPVLRRAFALSAIFSFCVPFAINAEVQRSLNVFKTGDAAQVRNAGSRIKYIAPLVNFEPLAQRKGRTGNSAELDRAIEETYFFLTGNSTSIVRPFPFD